MGSHDRKRIPGLRIHIWLGSERGNNKQDLAGIKYAVNNKYSEKIIRDKAVQLSNVNVGNTIYDLCGKARIESVRNAR